MPHTYTHIYHIKITFDDEISEWNWSEEEEEKKEKEDVVAKKSILGKYTKPQWALFETKLGKHIRKEEKKRESSYLWRKNCLGNSLKSAL